MSTIFISSFYLERKKSWLLICMLIILFPLVQILLWLLAARFVFSDSKFIRRVTFYVLELAWLPSVLFLFRQWNIVHILLDMLNNSVVYPFLDVYAGSTFSYNINVHENNDWYNWQFLYTKFQDLGIWSCSYFSFFCCIIVVHLFCIMRSCDNLQRDDWTR